MSSRCLRVMAENKAIWVDAIYSAFGSGSAVLQRSWVRPVRIGRIGKWIILVMNDISFAPELRQGSLIIDVCSSSTNKRKANFSMLDVASFPTKSSDLEGNNKNTINRYLQPFNKLGDIQALCGSSSPNLMTWKFWKFSNHGHVVQILSTITNPIY